jgi:hypothetical protein
MGRGLTHKERGMLVTSDYKAVAERSTSRDPSPVLPKTRQRRHERWPTHRITYIHSLGRLNLVLKQRAETRSSCTW